MVDHTAGAKHRSDKSDTNFETDVYRVKGTYFNVSPVDHHHSNNFPPRFHLFEKMRLMYSGEGILWVATARHSLVYMGRRVPVAQVASQCS